MRARGHALAAATAALLFAAVIALRPSPGSAPTKVPVQPLPTRPAPEPSSPAAMPVIEGFTPDLGTPEGIREALARLPRPFEHPYEDVLRVVEAAFAGRTALEALDLLSGIPDTEDTWFLGCLASHISEKRGDLEAEFVAIVLNDHRFAHRVIGLEYLGWHGLFRPGGQRTHAAVARAVFLDSAAHPLLRTRALWNTPFLVDDHTQLLDLTQAAYASGDDVLRGHALCALRNFIDWRGGAQPEAIAALRWYCTNGPTEHKLEALKDLGSWDPRGNGPPKAIVDMLRDIAAADADPDVRSAAAEALRGCQPRESPD